MEKRLYAKNLSHVTRKSIGITIIFLSLLIIISTFILLGIGFYTYSYLSSKIHLLRNDFSAGHVVIIYSVIGSSLVIGYSLLSCATFYSRRTKQKYKLLKKGHLNSLAWFLVISFVAIIKAIVHTIIHINRIRDGFTQGLLESMQRNDKKLSLDRLQIEYGCCGAKNYKDWFQMDWIQKEYRQGRSANNSVPYSCCSLKFVGPCMNEEIDSYAEESLNVEGCALVFSKALENIFIGATSLWFFILILQIIIIILFQYWRTSMLNAVLGGHPKQKAYGWLWREINASYSNLKQRQREKKNDSNRDSLKESDDEERKELVDGYGVDIKEGNYNINDTRYESENYLPLMLNDVTDQEFGSKTDARDPSSSDFNQMPQKSNDGQENDDDLIDLNSSIHSPFNTYKR